MGAALLAVMPLTLSDMQRLRTVTNNQCAALGALKQTKSVARDLKAYRELGKRLQFYIEHHPSHPNSRERRHG